MKETQFQLIKEMIFDTFEKSDISIGLFNILDERFIFQCCYKRMHFQVTLNYEEVALNYVLYPIHYGKIVEPISLNTLTETINTIYDISELNEKGEY